jgi:hypothetical protein
MVVRGIARAGSPFPLDPPSEGRVFFSRNASVRLANSHIFDRGMVRLRARAGKPQPNSEGGLWNRFFCSLNSLFQGEHPRGVSGGWQGGRWRKPVTGERVGVYPSSCPGMLGLRGVE